MTDQEAGAGSPDSVRTLVYSEDSESDRTGPAYYEIADARPWDPSAAIASITGMRRVGRMASEYFQKVKLTFGMVCGPRAISKGWDRIKTNPVPARKCKCCGQKIRNLRNAQEKSYVLTDHEYIIVDSILSRAFTEMNAAGGRTIERHLGNAYRILTENESVLENGLRRIVFIRVQNIVRVIYDLFRLTESEISESDIQTR